MAIPAVQTQVAKTVVNQLFSETEVDFELDKISIKPFSGIEIQNLYLSDQQKDTLAFIQSLNVSINDWKIDPLLLDFKTLSLNGVKFYIRINEQDSVTNLQFLIDRFSSDKKDTSTVNYQINLAKAELSQVQFKWNNYNYPDSTFGVNYNHIEVQNLGGLINGLAINQDSIIAKINTLHLAEKSGFELANLSTDFTLNNQMIDLDSLQFNAAETQLAGRYAMKHNAYSGFSDYINQVVMIARLDSAIISGYDLAFFVPQLEALNDQVYLAGNYMGTVSSFEMQDFLLRYKSKTYLSGKLDVHGLPKIEGTQLNIYLDDSYILRSDLEQITLPPYPSKKKLQVPNQLRKWRYAAIKGKFVGTLKNFITDADFNSNLGGIKTAIQVSQRGENTSYQGDIALRGLQAGNLLDNTDFNLISGKVNIKGSGIELKTADILAKGKLSAFDYRGYRYHDILLDGEIKDHLFEGRLNVNDKYCELNFDGSLNFLPHQDTFKFQLKVDTLYPVMLGLYDRDSSAFFSGNADINLIGLTLDTALGRAALTDIFYQEGDSSFTLDSLSVSSFVEDSLRQIHLNSSLGLISLKSDAVLKGVDEAVAKILDDAVPTYFEQNYDVKDNKGGLVLYASLNEKLNDVVSVFLPALRIDSSLEVRGGLFLNPPLLNFSIKSDGVNYSGFFADSIEVNGGFADSTFEVTSFTDMLGVNENLRIENLQITSNFQNDSVNLLVDYLNTGEKNYSGEINLGGKINSTHNFSFGLYESFIEVADSVWVFEPNNYVEIDSNYIQLKGLKVSSYAKYIALAGTVSKKKSDELKLSFSNLNLSNIGRMLNREDLDFAGVASGSVTARNALQSPSLSSNVKINGLEFNQMPMGSGKLQSKWDNELQRVEVDFDLIRLPDSIIPDTVHSLKIAGNIYPNNEQQQLDLSLGTDGFYLKSLEPFTKTFMDSLDGRISGSIDVLGQFSQPILQGEFDITDTRFRVKYLNTTYYAKKEKLRIEEDWFGFDNLKLYDQFGNKAFTIATVYHTNYAEMNYDVSVNMKDFFVLNTTKFDNDLYYGKGYLSGDVNLFGYDQTLFMEMNGKATKKSEFVIPLTGAAEIGQSDFITFVNADGSVEESDEKALDLSGIEMTFNLEVDPTTNIRMIFDETTGDELNSRGNGKIKMEINSAGDFGMFGKYTVFSGNYGFTYRNMFSKKFELEEGGTILWSGDPLNAELDLTAIYNVRAPLGVILHDSTMTTKVNNQCLLKMSDQLLEPKINFGIRLPDASPGIAQQVKSQMNTQEEVTKQVFSLLLFNKYSPPQSGFNAGGIVQASSSDLISNQLNNWISKLDNQLFDFGVNEVKSDEVEVSLSKRFLNNRLILESNVGVNRNDEEAQESENGQVVGDFKIEYLITENGKVRGKVFNRTENRSSIETQSGANAQTQGVGIVLREDFNSPKELWQKMFNNPTRKKKRQDRKAERAQRKAAKRED